LSLHHEVIICENRIAIVVGVAYRMIEAVARRRETAAAARTNPAFQLGEDA